MKKLLIRILYFLPLACVLFAVNYYADPANMFHQSTVTRLSDILLSGKNAAYSSPNFDERLLQRRLINHFDHKMNIVVLGSSRVMNFGNNIFPNRMVFNSFVSGATLQDLMAIYFMYRSRNLLPDTMIVGLDPWMLNHNNKQDNWQTLAQEYQQMLTIVKPDTSTEQGTLKLKWKKLSELFTFSYFQTSLKSLIRNKGRIDRNNVYETLNSTEDCCYTKLADGRVYYNKAYREKTSIQIVAEAERYARNKPVYSLGSFNQADPSLTALLKAFLIQIKSDGPVLILFLPPYNPVAYQIITDQPKYHMVARSEKLFRDFARDNNIALFGSYNPSTFDLKPGDFFDGMHFRDETLKKIISQSFNRHMP